jgi:hypothetical protein
VTSALRPTLLTPAHGDGKEAMDWTLAIERNRVAHLRIVAMLFVHAGLDEGGAETQPRHAWRLLAGRHDHRRM